MIDWAEIRGAVSELTFVLQGGTARGEARLLCITEGSVFPVSRMWFSFGVDGKRRKDVRAV